jgi:hypothetical protein
MDTTGLSTAQLHNRANAYPEAIVVPHHRDLLHQHIQVGTVPATAGSGQCALQLRQLLLVLLAATQQLLQGR